MKSMHNVVMRKSTSHFYGGRQVACVAREDVPVIVLPRKNTKRKPLPVPVNVMYNHIICAKGRYAD